MRTLLHTTSERVKIALFVSCSANKETYGPFQVPKSAEFYAMWQLCQDPGIAADISQPSQHQPPPLSPPLFLSREEAADRTNEKKEKKEGRKHRKFSRQIVRRKEGRRELSF